MGNMIENLSDAEVLALKKAIDARAEKIARNGVDVGTHHIDRLFHMVGSVTVGADYNQDKTSAMPTKRMLLSALMLNGTCIEAFIRRYLDNEFEVTKEQEKEMDSIWKKLAGAFNQTFSGKVTSDLAVTGIDAPPHGTEKESLAG
jgi:hypothetical protein